MNARVKGFKLTDEKKKKMNGCEKSQTSIKKISPTTTGMPGLMFSSAAQWSPVIQFILVSFGILLSFLIAYKRGDVNAYLPFISETGAFSPEKCIFSLALIIGSFIGCVFMIFRYLVIAENPLNGGRVFFKLNQASLLIGISSMIGLASVAAFPMTTVFWAHLLSAGIYFVGSSIYIVLSTVITYIMNGRSHIFIFRSIISISVIVLQAIMVIVFPIALKKWHEENEIIPALKTPDHKGFTLLLIASCLEWSIVSLIASYHMSFIFELRNYNLCLKANRYSAVDETSEAIDDPVPV